MTQYTPPIASRETEELIAIAHSSLDYWQQDAIDQAKQELEARKVSIEEQQAIMQKWAEIIEQQELEIERQRQRNALEKYKGPEMAEIILTTPLILVGKGNAGLSLSELKRENYRIKFRQRIILLIIGILFYVWVISLPTKGK